MLIIEKSYLSHGEFFNFLKIFFSDNYQESGRLIEASRFYPETIELLRSIDLFVKTFNKTNFKDSTRWNDKGFAQEQNFAQLVKAIESTEVFPQLSCISRYTRICNRNIENFLTFLENYLCPKETNKQNNSERFFRKNIINLYGQNWYYSFLEQYCDHLREQPVNLRDQNAHVFPLKLKQEVLDDLTQQVVIAGMLYVLSLKINIDHELPISNSEFRSFYSDELEHPLGLLDTEEGIIRTYCKPIVGPKHSLQYFVILLIQDTGNSFSEQDMSFKVKTILESYYNNKNSLISINVKNLNQCLRDKILVEHRGPFFLSEFSNVNTAIVWKWFFEFLYQWDEFQIVSIDFLRSFVQNMSYKPRSNFYFERNNKPKPIKYLYSLHHLDRAKSIWKTSHLSQHTQDYFKNLSTIYAELLWQERGLAKFLKLLECIEIFMLTIKEAYYVTFEDNKQNWQSWHIDKPIEDYVSRSLLQFIELATYHQDILQVEKKLDKIYCSRLLNYFIDIYMQHKMYIETMLGKSFTRLDAKAPLKKFLSLFIYPHEIFLKQAINNPEWRIANPHKVIDIPRHKNRTNTVKSYINNAMKGDVVIVRCRLSCVGLNISLKQKALSALFYEMMHAGKRRVPLSQITGYLGFWDVVELPDSICDQFWVDVIFIFKQQVLLQHSDLHKSIEEAWYKTVQKAFNNYNPDLLYRIEFKKEIIMRSVNELQTEQLVIETINSKRKKAFLQGVIPFVVYRDLLDNEFYRLTPKWLIRGTQPRNKKPTKKVVQQKKADPNR